MNANVDVFTVLCQGLEKRSKQKKTKSLIIIAFYILLLRLQMSFAKGLDIYIHMPITFLILFICYRIRSKSKWVLLQAAYGLRMLKKVASIKSGRKADFPVKSRFLFDFFSLYSLNVGFYFLSLHRIYAEFTRT